LILKIPISEYGRHNWKVTQRWLLYVSPFKDGDGKIISPPKLGGLMKNIFYFNLNQNNT